jgi:hypothetical protein
MNKQEIKEWIKSADLADTMDLDHDECGNYWRTNIYKKDGKYFRLSFCNREPSEKWEMIKDLFVEYMSRKKLLDIHEW